MRRAVQLGSVALALLWLVVPLAPDATDEAVARARTTARARLDALADDVRTALDLPAA